MERWIKGIRERFPLLTYMALVVGISLSGLYLGNGAFDAIPFTLSFISLLFIFFEERLIDELFHFEQDKVARQDRPLVRGLVIKHEAVKGFHVLQTLLFALSIATFVLLNGVAALLLALTILTLWVMHNECFLGAWLRRHPLLLTLSRQLYLLPAVLFACAVNNSSVLMMQEAWTFVSLLLGAFICYDICRKLDPHIHPILATLIHFYGFRRTFEIAALGLAISAMSAMFLNLSLLLFPVELIVLATLALLFFQPAYFKIPEVVAGISLMLHVWAVVLYHYLFERI